MVELKTLLHIVRQESEPLVQAHLLHQNRDVLERNGYTADQHLDISAVYQTIAARMEDPELKKLCERKGQEYQKKANAHSSPKPV